MSRTLFFIYVCDLRRATVETLSEDHTQNPINPYGRSKLMIERVVEDLAKTGDINYTFLRYFNAAGADLDGETGERHNPETHLIPLAIQAVLGKRGELTVFGDDYPTKDGSCIRDYIHVNDLADAHILALESYQRRVSPKFIIWELALAILFLIY